MPANIDRTPLRALSPIEIELKPSVEAEESDRSTSPELPPAPKTLSSSIPIKTTPNRKGRNPAPVYAPSDVSSEAEEDDEYRNETEEPSEDEYVEDAASPSLPSSPPSSPASPTSTSTPSKKRRQPTQTSNSPDKKPRATKARSTVTKGSRAGAFTPAEDLALLEGRRPLLAGAAWKDLADSIGRNAKACQDRFQVLDKKWKEMILKGKH